MPCRTPSSNSLAAAVGTSARHSLLCFAGHFSINRKGILALNPTQICCHANMKGESPIQIVPLKLVLIGDASGVLLATVAFPMVGRELSSGILAW